MNKESNLEYSGGIADVSSADSKVKILVIPTNEEYEIAHQCFGLLA